MGESVGRRCGNVPRIGQPHALSHRGADVVRADALAGHQTLPRRTTERPLRDLKYSAESLV